MSNCKPLTSDEASDAQSLEDILRQMTLDQYPRFPSIVGHIARHFVNLHPDERRYVLAWLREVIRNSCQLAQPLPFSPEAQSWKKDLMEDYARLSNRDPSFLPMVFEIQRWFPTPEDDGRQTISQLEYLHYYIQFMFYLKEVSFAMKEGSLDLTERYYLSEEESASSECVERASEDVDHHIRDESRFVMYFYGFNTYPRPTVDNAILRIRQVYLAFSIEKEARAVLNSKEFDNYESVLEESLKTITNHWYRYDKEMSLETLGKFYDIAETHEDLRQLLMEVPWYHLHESNWSTSVQ